MAEKDTDKIINADAGTTELMEAASRGKREEVERLIKAGANPNKPDSTGDSAIFYANAWSNVDIIAILKKNGANLEQRNNKGKTALITAAESYDVETAKALLNNGANINNTITDPTHSPYYFIETIMFDLHDRTALHQAVKNDDIDMVDMLLTNQADIKAETFSGRTPLHMAAANSSPEVLNRLLQEKPTIDAKDAFGKTPLFIAVEEGNLDVANILVTKGADTKAQSLINETLLHVAAAQPKVTQNDINKLIANGLSVEAISRQKETMLHKAAESGKSMRVAFFIEQGLNVNAKDLEGNTPLHNASNALAVANWDWNEQRDESQYPEVIKTLVDNGADVNAVNERKETPLHKAVLSGGLDRVNTILASVKDNAKRKVLLNQQDEEGNTALHHALKQSNIYNSHTELAVTLIHNGADVNVINKLGHSAKDYADAHAAIKKPQFGGYQSNVSKQDLLNTLSAAGAQTGADIDGQRLQKIMRETKEMPPSQMMEHLGAELVKPTVFSQQDRQDSFGDIPKLTSQKPKDKVVHTYSIESFPTENPNGIHEHIQWTTDVISGVRHQLSNGASDSRTYGIADMPLTVERHQLTESYKKWATLDQTIDSSVIDATMDISLRALIRRPETKAEEIVVNLSWGEMKEFGDVIEANPQEKDLIAARKFFDQHDGLITFRAVGNSGDMYDFQDASPVFHTKKSASVAAAEEGEDGKSIIQGYSEDNPTFAAPLSLKDKLYEDSKEKEVLPGTSFASPYAVAVYAELSENHGKSKANPNGLTYEEIMYAMAASADRDISSQLDSTKSFVPIVSKINGAGLGYSEQAGFGVINAHAADQFALRMVEAKKDIAIQTLSIEQNADITTKSYSLDEKTGAYIYKIPITEDILVQNIRLTLKSDKGHNLDATLEADGITADAYLSSTGRATIHQHMGETLKAGSILKLRTSEPLDAGSDIAIRGVNADSVTGAIVEMDRAANVASITKINERNIAATRDMLVQQQKNITASGFQNPDMTKLTATNVNTDITNNIATSQAYAAEQKSVMRPLELMAMANEKGHAALITAHKKMDTAAYEQLKQMGLKQAKAIDEEGKTLLHYAFDSVDIKKMLSSGVPVNHLDKDGTTALDAMNEFIEEYPYMAMEANAKRELLIANGAKTSFDLALDTVKITRDALKDGKTQTEQEAFKQAKQVLFKAVDKNRDGTLDADEKKVIIENEAAIRKTLEIGSDKTQSYIIKSFEKKIANNPELAKQINNAVKDVGNTIESEKEDTNNTPMSAASPPHTPHQIIKDISR